MGLGCLIRVEDLRFSGFRGFGVEILGLRGRRVRGRCEGYVGVSRLSPVPLESLVESSNPSGMVAAQGKISQHTHVDP